jgi:Gas vesicle synthesis protein GvpL/GvpF
MPCLLYCVTRADSEVVTSPVGVCDEPVQAQEFDSLRVYWSEIADPETALANGAARKNAELKFRQVLREIVTHFTPIAVPFPVVLADLEAVEKHIVEEREHFEEALNRLGETVQYEMIASWTADDQADLATPVSGREYLKRRQEAEERIAAIDNKLKTVTTGIVREWRARQDRRKHHWFALVARQDRERFIAALRSAGPSEGVRLRLSGPWPPSEFVRTLSDSQ